MIDSLIISHFVVNPSLNEEENTAQTYQVEP